MSQREPALESKNTAVLNLPISTRPNTKLKQTNLSPFLPKKITITTKKN